MTAPAWLVDRLVAEVRAIEDGATCDSAECFDCSLVEVKDEMVQEGPRGPEDRIAWLCLPCFDRREREYWA